MRWHAWAIAAGAATTLLFACVGSSPTLPTTQCDGDPGDNQFCNGACTNVKGDSRNCGKCGATCAMGEVCQKGACGPACSGGTSRCGNGCADVQNDPQNCGDCNKKCASVESCVMGKCTLVCQAGLTSCPRAMTAPVDGGTMPEGGTSEAGAPSGSECTDTNTDPVNCGKCGTVCPSDKATCNKGQCKVGKFPGVLTNVAQDDLSSEWMECFSETYNINTTTIASIMTQKCTQANLMLACRQTGQKTLVVAAEAPRADVSFDNGLPSPYGPYYNSSLFKIANGTAWYYSQGCLCNTTQSGSWGFFQADDIVNRIPFDTAMGLAPEKRLSWTVGNVTPTLTGGYRCGANVNLQMNATYERVIFQSP